MENVKMQQSYFICLSLYCDCASVVTSPLKYNIYQIIFSLFFFIFSSIDLKLVLAIVVRE